MRDIAPLQDSIKAIQHEPEYTVHRYFARRPHNVINNIIRHYAPEPNSLILDPFGGGGTMVYEALVCGHRSIAYDTSDLATFVMEQEALMPSVNIDVLARFVQELMINLDNKFTSLYTFQGAEVYWIEWSTYTDCPKCGSTVFLSPLNAVGSGKYSCSTCNGLFKPEAVDVNNIKPVEICCMGNGSIKSGKSMGQVRLKPGVQELSLYYETLCSAFKDNRLGDSLIPVTQIPDCNLQRESALHKKGICFYEQFIPTASRGVIQYIGDYINDSALNNEQKRQLLFVLSASLRYCSRFSSRNQAWRGDKPMEWAKSNFWTPYTYVEVNPIITFYERWQSYLLAVKNSKKKFTTPPRNGNCDEVLSKQKEFSIINASSESIPEIPDSSVDLVVTDPPYGSYLHYGELSAFWTTWLSKFLPDISALPDRNSEAVPARKKGYPGWKSFDQYEKILLNVFLECYRVLVDNGYCVVTFNNKEPEAWIAFLRSVKKAGFILPNGGIIFQDGVEAYKKSIDSRRGGAIFGDFIYSFRKLPNHFMPVDNHSHDWREKIDESLFVLATQNETITNVELYTKIYIGFLPELYRAIDPDTASNKYIEGLTFKNFESEINKYFYFLDGVWYRKS